jgi:hypothetical protein
MRYIVHEITGQYAISFDDGQQLSDLISPQLLTGQTVEIDFAESRLFQRHFSTSLSDSFCKISILIL